MSAQDIVFVLKTPSQARKMAQWLRALADLPKVLSSIPAYYGGSKPSIMGFDTFFWYADVHADSILTYIK